MAAVLAWRGQSCHEMHICIFAPLYLAQNSIPKHQTRCNHRVVAKPNSDQQNKNVKTAALSCSSRPTPQSQASSWAQGARWPLPQRRLAALAQPGPSAWSPRQCRCRCRHQRQPVMMMVSVCDRKNGRMPAHTYQSAQADEAQGCVHVLARHTVGRRVCIFRGRE